MERKYSVIYIGLDINTFVLLLEDKRVDIKAVNLIPDFIHHNTFNPANLLFKLVYFLHYIDRFRKLKLISYKIWHFVNFSSSSIYNKYSNYLYYIISQNIKIIDLKDTKEFQKYVKSNQIDINVINNWWLLPTEIILSPKFGSINIHPSKLPQYRGSLPTLWALKNNDCESAVTFMLLDKTMDGGRILSQHIFKIENTDNAIDLEYKIEKITASFLISDVISYLSGLLNPTIQNESLASKTDKYEKYRKISPQIEKGRDIENKVKLYPYLWPLDRCYLQLKNRKLFIDNAEFIQSNKSKKVQIRFPYVYIPTTDGVLKIKMNLFQTFLIKFNSI